MAYALAPVILVSLFCLSAAPGTGTDSRSVSESGPNEDYDGICSSMVGRQGYACEEHKVLDFGTRSKWLITCYVDSFFGITCQVVTRDGYIISVQRIPAVSPGEKAGYGSPVLLQHGVLMDGVTWLLLPAHRSLAFLLADNGFDIWIANTRGTKYSRGHVSLHPNDPSYWDWSWNELVAHEIPATIQYVHDQTSQKLHYVGHSLGTLIALASLSKDQMLRSVALLSPIARVGHMTSPLARNAAENFLAETLYWLGIHEFVPRGEAVMKLIKEMCEKPGIDCTDLLTSFTGENCCIESSIVDVFLEHEPQSTSTKNMIHLAQMIRDGTTAMLNYGDESENWRRYRQANPPAYNITGVPTDLPIFLSYGGSDALSDTKDMTLLLESLRNHDADKLVVQYREDYAHADYVMAENAKEVVYDPLIAFFRKLQ